MKKVVEIKGMSCEHCQNRVQKALNALPESPPKSASRRGRPCSPWLGAGRAGGQKRRHRCGLWGCGHPGQEGAFRPM